MKKEYLIYKLSESVKTTSKIDNELFVKYNVKRGLRNDDGTGVLVGLTQIGDVVGYERSSDGSLKAIPGKLYYRGYDVDDIVHDLVDKQRFGFEEVAYLMLSGKLPDREELENFRELLNDNMPLEQKTKMNIIDLEGQNIMNTLARSVLEMYNFDPNPGGATEQGQNVAPTPVAQKEKKPYYEIEGHRFENGSTIYLPLSNTKSYEITAYKDSAQLFPSGTRWRGISNRDSSSAIFTPTRVSRSIAGTTISTKRDSDVLECKIVVVNVEIQEDPTQKWGFDENNPLTENDYPSYKTTPIEGIKWKSLRTDGTPDLLQVSILPMGAESQVKFTAPASDVQVSPLTNIGNSIHRFSVAMTRSETELIANVGYFVNNQMQIKLYGTAEHTRTARVIIVNEENDDIQEIPFGDSTSNSSTIVISSGNNRFLDSRETIDIRGDDKIVYDSITQTKVVVAGPNKLCESHAYNTDVRTSMVSIEDMRSTLNEHYRQSVYKWMVDYIEERSINFDLNQDGKIDVDTWENEETQAIFNACIDGGDIFTIFVVNNPSDGSAGFSNFNNPQKSCFVHPENSANPYMTTCHELGHGAFGLKHPFNEFIGFPIGGKDVLNIMNYGNLRKKFRKYQWDKIR